MFPRIVHRVLDVPSGIFEDELFTAGVIREEMSNVEDFALIGNPAAALRVMLKNIRGSENANALRHGRGGDDDGWREVGAQEHGVRPLGLGWSWPSLISRPAPVVPRCCSCL